MDTDILVIDGLSCWFVRECLVFSLKHYIVMRIRLSYSSPPHSWYNIRLRSFDLTNEKGDQLQNIMATVKLSTRHRMKYTT